MLRKVFIVTLSCLNLLVFSEVQGGGLFSRVQPPQDDLEGKGQEANTAAQSKEKEVLEKSEAQQKKTAQNQRKRDNRKKAKQRKKETEALLNKVSTLDSNSASLSTSDSEESALENATEEWKRNFLPPEDITLESNSESSSSVDSEDSAFGGDMREVQEETPTLATLNLETFNTDKKESPPKTPTISYCSVSLSKQSIGNIEAVMTHVRGDAGLEEFKPSFDRSMNPYYHITLCGGGVSRDDKWVTCGPRDADAWKRVLPSHGIARVQVPAKFDVEISGQGKIVLPLEVASGSWITENGRKTSPRISGKLHIDVSAWQDQMQIKYLTTNGERGKKPQKEVTINKIKEEVKKNFRGAIFELDLNTVKCKND